MSDIDVSFNGTEIIIRNKKYKFELRYTQPHSGEEVSQLIKRAIIDYSRQINKFRRTHSELTNNQDEMLFIIENHWRKTKRPMSYEQMKIVKGCKSRTTPFYACQALLKKGFVEKVNGKIIPVDFS